MKIGKHMSSETEHFRFATINIRFDNDKDPWTWPDRLVLLKERLFSIAPDIIATQEGRKKQLLELKDALAPNYQMVDSHRDWDEYKMYPCLFYNPKRLLLSESYDRWLSRTPEVPHSKSFGSAWPKLAVIASFSSKKTSKIFATASFHFDNESSEARPKQAEILLEQIDDCCPENMRILLGDANDKVNSKTLAILKKSGYQDPWNFSDAPPSFHGFGNQKIASRIDYVLYQGSNVSLEDYNTDSVSQPYYSDHAIIYATFKTNT